MNAVLAPEAVEDLSGCVAYLATRNSIAANRLVDRVFQMIEQLAEGGIDGIKQTLKSGEEVRSWPIPPLRIYYRREASRLVVLRIYNLKRSPLTK